MDGASTPLPDIVYHFLISRLGGRVFTVLVSHGYGANVLVALRDAQLLHQLSAFFRGKEKFGGGHQARFLAW